MNKVTLIFTALAAYKQARAQESTTLRGIIIGSLTVAAIVTLWFMGADLSAEQIGLIITSIAGFDQVLKIVLPDQLGAKKNENGNPAENLDGNNPAGNRPVDPLSTNRLRQLPTDDGLREDSRPDPAPQPDNDGFGHNDSA
ncbi:MAG: hypothetical protein RKO25_03820 [Candidatus Contendobacter sp.]|nr:hypothetical protein [Candidatus Contendobacter sp.]